MTELAGVVLAAGLGTRLRPITDHTPKALVPVGGRPLVDWAIDRLVPHTHRIAVNAHHHLDQMLAHLAAHDVHVSVEMPEPLGTAGALGQLHDWLDGADVLLTNADAWITADLGVLVAGWSGEKCRLLVVADSQNEDFPGGWRYAGACLLPGPLVARLPARPAGLYETLWRGGDVDLVSTEARCIDCGTAADLAAANAAAAAS